jgi:hypothetical protein
MNRRAFFSSLAGFAAPGAAQSQQKRWYITGGLHLDPKQNDCNVSPLVAYGRDRLDAVANSGITVWEAERYEREVMLPFAKSCADRKR